jgi:hypothetical protein
MPSEKSTNCLNYFSSSPLNENSYYYQQGSSVTDSPPQSSRLRQTSSFPSSSFLVFLLRATVFAFRVTSRVGPFPSRCSICNFHFAVINLQSILTHSAFIFPLYPVARPLYPRVHSSFIPHPSYFKPHPPIENSQLSLFPKYFRPFFKLFWLCNYVQYIDLRRSPVPPP